MKIRIKFTKTGTMRFIGHLDLMRYFQKLMRRAKVDIRYSEGFSPHQVMSFATAMGLGMTSEGEYVDIDVLSTESSGEMTRRLNAASNEEIQILKYRQIPDETKSAMSQIAAADYVVSFSKESIRDAAFSEAGVRETGALEAGKAFSETNDREETAKLQNMINGEKCPSDLSSFEWLKKKTAQFCSQESIVLLKKTKKSEQEVDIRPMIFQLSGILEDDLFQVGNEEPDKIQERKKEPDGIRSRKGNPNGIQDGNEESNEIRLGNETPNTIQHENKEPDEQEKEVVLKDISICPDYIREIAPSDEYIRVFMRLATGSEQNLKPELVMEAFFRFLGQEAPEEAALKIHRTEIYGKRDDTLIPLSEYGWDI